MDVIQEEEVSNRSGANKLIGFKSMSIETDKNASEHGSSLHTPEHDAKSLKKDVKQEVNQKKVTWSQ